MKKIILLTVAMVLVASVAFGANTIVGSRHDLSSVGVNGQVCIFCHTPHNANTSAGPLWSHSASAKSYSVYASATLNNTPTAPGGVSKACLGCHDGSIAVGAIAYGRTSGDKATTGKDGAESYAAGSVMINGAQAGNPLLGTDLRDDHPVSIPYVNTYDAGLRAPTGTLVVNGAVSVQLFGTASPYTVECASCHDVHSNLYVPFLVTSNVNSQICTACHIK